MAYHNNTTFTLTDPSVGIDLDTLSTKIDALVIEADVASSEPTKLELLGANTLVDGGLYGDILRLTRIHINDMKKLGELGKQVSGEVYASMLSAALQASITFLTSSKSEHIKNLQVKASLLGTLMDASVKKSELLMSQFKTQGEEFQVKYVMPKQVENIEEDIEGKHIQHAISSYNLSDILPTDKALKVAQTTVQSSNKLNIDKDTAIKAYNLTDILPIEKTIKTSQNLGILKDTAVKDYNLTDILPTDKALKVAQKDIQTYTLSDILPQDKALKIAQVSTQTAQSNKLVSDKTLVDKDILIKTYYNSSIQPQEKNLTEAKATIERGSAGLVGGGVNIGSLKSLQLAKQTELYERQRQMYDEKKYLEIFKAQANYQTLIFSDLGSQVAVSPLTTVEMKKIYNAVAPTVVQTVPAVL